MSFSLTKSIVPMSELRSDPERIKKQLKHSPVVITNKGKPDFGICDLETLEIASRVKSLRDLLVARKESVLLSRDAREVFRELDAKYGI